MLWQNGPQLLIDSDCKTVLTWKFVVSRFPLLSWGIMAFDQSCPRLRHYTTIIDIKWWFWLQRNWVILVKICNRYFAFCELVVLKDNDFTQHEFSVVQLLFFYIYNFLKFIYSCIDASLTRGVSGKLLYFRLVEEELYCYHGQCNTIWSTKLSYTEYPREYLSWAYGWIIARRNFVLKKTKMQFNDSIKFPKETISYQL